MPTIVLDVLVTLDCFWPHLRSLESLSLLTRTSKSIRAGCDLAFAVSAMGADRTVEKRWAARWLGLPVRCMPARQDVTLAFALRLLASKGGLAVTHARAVEFRRKEQADKAGRWVGACCSKWCVHTDNPAGSPTGRSGTSGPRTPRRSGCGSSRSARTSAWWTWTPASRRSGS